MRIWKPDIKVAIDPEIIAGRGANIIIAKKALVFSQRNTSRRLVKVLVNDSMRFEANIQKGSVEVWQRVETFDLTTKVS